MAVDLPCGLLMLLLLVVDVAVAVVVADDNGEGIIYYFNVW